MKRRIVRNAAGLAVLLALGAAMYLAAQAIVASGHQDALAVAIIAVAIIGVLVRAHTRRVRALRATYEAIRDRDRAAFWRLNRRYAEQVRQQAAKAAGPAGADEPIPYLPVFTAGAPPDYGEA